MEARWTETTKRIVAVAGVLLGLLLLYLGRVVLPMVLIAAVIGYALYPAVSFFRRRLRFPQTLATVAVYLLLLLILASVPVLVGPFVVRQFQALDVNFLELAEQARQWVRETLQVWRAPTIAGAVIDLSSLVDPALDALGEQGTLPDILQAKNWLPWLVKKLPGFASTLSSAFIAFFLTMLYSFYMVKDAPQLGGRLDQMIPERYRDELHELRHRLTRIWSSFFRGQLLLCLVMALISFAVLMIIGIRAAIPLAILAGLMEVVPNLGPILALVPAVLVALIQGSTWIPLSNGWVALIVVGAYVLIQQVENNFLCPRIVGGSIELPPIVVLVGVVVGVTSAGLVGAYLSGPILASIKILGLYSYNKVLDRPPFPESLEEEQARKEAAQEARRRRPKQARTP